MAAWSGENAELRGRLARLDAELERRAKVARGLPATLSVTASFGSGPLSMMELAPFVSGGEEDVFAEQVEFGATVHLSFDHFDVVDIAFDSAGAGGQRETVADGGVVAP